MFKVVFRYFVLLLTHQLYGAISKAFQGPRWADSKRKFFSNEKSVLDPLRKRKKKEEDETGPPEALSGFSFSLSV